MSQSRQPRSLLVARPCLPVPFSRHQQPLPFLKALFQLPHPQLQPPPSHRQRPVAKPASLLLTLPPQPAPCTACVPRHRPRLSPATARPASPSTAAVTAAAWAITKMSFTCPALALPLRLPRDTHPPADRETRPVRVLVSVLLLLLLRRRRWASHAGVFSLLRQLLLLPRQVLLRRFLPRWEGRARVRLVLRSRRSVLT